MERIAQKEPSKTQTVTINRANPTVIIGERINSTRSKKVLAALQAGNFDIVRRDTLAQVAAGAAVLAADLAMGRDDYGMNWIKAFRSREAANDK